MHNTTYIGILMHVLCSVYLTYLIDMHVYICKTATYIKG